MADTPERIVESYLSRLAEIRSTGGATAETSYYSALETLLNQVGRTLDPHVICNAQLRNQGAGHPDFGLYSRKQCQKGEPKPGQGETPERGVIEVKPLADKTWQTTKGKQATKYFGHYRLVLITNYREFRLIGGDENGNPVEREFLSLAESETNFWAIAAHPKKFAAAEAKHFVEFLRRVLMNNAPLTKARDVAWFLASYARDALVTLENRDASALDPIRTALETALGIRFEGEKGEHFFRSTLVQTLFYGVFSAWVISARLGGTGLFDWRHSSFLLTVPMVKTLFEEISKPSRLTPLGLMGVLDRTGESLNRIDRKEFFKSFDTGQAIQHFYEPFLKEFDPELRKEMGVWYTPPEIVRYIVARVDTVLRTELKVPDGLAGDNVYVLDPCCGTGTFVVEVLRKIEETLRKKNNDSLVGQDVKDAAQHRVFGFEIMSAPFVIAHWRVGDLLADEGLNAAFDPQKGERPAIYLTNALTGWEPPIGPKATFPMFPELAAERDQAEHVKRDVPILVVLGNPPYNAYAGTSPEEEKGLVEPYKSDLITKWKIKKFNLDELYVRFFRIAERRIVKTGRGLFCYISSFSYLGDPSFVVARERLLSEFSHIWIDCMNGDSRETGKLTPSGDPDPSVFSTEFNREGIKLGTAVGLFVREGQPTNDAVVRFRHFWGNKKREALLESLAAASFDKQYEISAPKEWNKLSFKPGSVQPNYLKWPKLSDLSVVAPINGLMEKRAGALIDIDKESLQQRMARYFDKMIDWDTYRLSTKSLTSDAGRFKAKRAREAILASRDYDPARVVRYFLRPFDIRYAYHSEKRPLWNEPRPALWQQLQHPNCFLVSRPAAVAQPEGIPVGFTRCLGDNDAYRGHAYYIPFLNVIGATGLLAATSAPNLSGRAMQYLDALGLGGTEPSAKAALIWHHALAICFSPKYLAENTDGLAVNWPRIPLPQHPSLLISSARIGAELANLLDTETAFADLPLGGLGSLLNIFGNITGTNLSVTAGWGRVDTQGKVFPGRESTTVRAWSQSEQNAVQNAVGSVGIHANRCFELLGRAVDVKLNGSSYWSAVPEHVWNYYVGGYQVIKKWLSYREESILERPLTPKEAREVAGIVRRLAAIVLMTDTLDLSYIAVRDSGYEV